MSRETADGPRHPNSEGIDVTTKPNTLAKLAEKYNCDKWFFHSYIPFYQMLFDDMETRGPIKKLLEVGIGYEDLMKLIVPEYIHGASLKMWEEYFPEADIWGCDIREDTLFQQGRIRTLLCDQRDAESVQAVIRQTPPLDVIIDDGSHYTADQIFTATILLPHVAPGGVYIVEDVQEPEFVAESLGGQFIKFPKRMDDNLVVIRR